MIGKLEFTTGLSRIGLSVRQVFSAEEQGVYYEALGPQTDAAEWEAFTRAAVLAQRWPTFLPTVSQVLDAIREFRGAPPLEPEAVAAYERVLGAGVYTAEARTSWTFRQVQLVCGRAAAEAFLAAGGDAAFRTSWQEDKRRAKFLEAYVSVARSEPSARCLPAPQEEKALPAPADAVSHDDAARILDKVRVLAGDGKLSRQPVIVEATPERLAFLKRQRDELLAAEAGGEASR